MKDIQVINFSNMTIEEKKAINPSFSYGRIRVMYDGLNRKNTFYTREVILENLMSIFNIPIVGELKYDGEDFTGHGGAIDMESGDIISTTIPYGVVSESAKISWEFTDGREYLVIDDCIMWTGKNKHLLDLLSTSKGQSMVVRVEDFTYDVESGIYYINKFHFIELCILGDHVTPCFEDASYEPYVENYSLRSEEYQSMIQEFSRITQEEEEKNMKELLAKYNIQLSDLTKLDIKFSEMSLDELENVIKSHYQIQPECSDASADACDNCNCGKAEAKEALLEDEADDKSEDEADAEDAEGETPEAPEAEGEAPEADTEDAEGETPEADAEDAEGEDDSYSIENAELKDKISKLEETISNYELELTDLREFKQSVEREAHEEAANAIFQAMQLGEEDVSHIEIHQFSLDEIEDKAYAILGRKMSEFNLDKEKPSSVKLPIQQVRVSPPEDEFAEAFEYYSKKK